jgi:hypothetical protein
MARRREAMSFGELRQYVDRPGIPRRSRAQFLSAIIFLDGRIKLGTLPGGKRLTVTRALDLLG